MKGKVQCVVQAVLLAMVCLPLPAAAAGIFAPYILHPLRREITQGQVVEADRTFARNGATREDLVATARDGVVLRGWKVRAPHPNGKWILLLHGRSQNRLSMMGYAHFLLASGYSVAMMDARAHGDSGGTISTYGHIERYDVSATLDALTASENVDHAYALENRWERQLRCRPRRSIRASRRSWRRAPSGICTK